MATSRIFSLPLPTSRHQTMPGVGLPVKKTPEAANIVYPFPASRSQLMNALKAFINRQPTSVKLFLIAVRKPQRDSFTYTPTINYPFSATRARPLTVSLRPHPTLFACYIRMMALL